MTITTIGSTIPSNGDTNPYGVAVVKHTVGNLHQGDILVSNFNNGDNVQGTGSTIVKFRGTTQTLFAQINSSTISCPGGVGLTTALEILKRGWVIVGSLPTQGGNISGSGCLIILNTEGHVVKTIVGHHINGPWDSTLLEHENTAYLFVTNVLNGNVITPPSHVVNDATVVRLEIDSSRNPPSLKSSVVIGSGFGEKTDPAALIIGPTGLALKGDDLFVADTLNNRISRIPNAVHRVDTAYSGADVCANGLFNGPLGLIFAPHFNNSLVAANSGDSLLVEVNTSGDQITGIDTGAGAGGLFGLAVSVDGNHIYFVNDNANSLQCLSD